jgi:long-chain acyl-CoA synthetase
MHTFQDPLRHALASHAHSEAVVCGDVRQDFATTIDRCQRLAAGLRNLGLERGDRVAVVAQNCHRYIEAYLAIPAAGFVLVPLNSRHTDHELSYAAVDAGARILITDRPPSDLDSDFEHVVRIPDDYEALLDTPAEPFPDDVAETDLAGLFYTGGTTGAAKGVMLTHRNLIANTWSCFSWNKLARDDRYLVVAPLFHAAGSVAVLGSIWVGATQVIQPAFEPNNTLDLLESERITSTLLVPTMLAAASDVQLEDPRDVSSLRMLSHGASPATMATLRRAVEAFPGVELVHLYGATEAAPLVTALPDEQLLLDTPLGRSCGAASMGVEIAILDQDDERMEADEIGEVGVRGPNIMQGYWGRPDDTEAALRSGWYHSGDVGRIDSDGHLFLVDRSKDMIVTGGENVYSTEVEDAIASHPAVAEVAVIGVPNERWGEAVHAVVVTRSPVDEAELIEHCRSTIAGYKVPKSMEISDQPLPKSSAGKILKRTLREPHWAGYETRIS